jgi:aldose 1-epimerase
MPVDLSTDRLRLSIDPDAGAGLLVFSALVGDAWLPMMPDSRQKSCDLAAASFLMIPYSNRIADGAFSFEGQSYQLGNGEAHAIHGDTRKRPWRITEQDDTRVSCAFSSTEHEAVNWPWPFEATATYELSDGAVCTLRMSVSVTNRGDTAMPAGFGWHPYFSRHLTRPGEPVRLRFPLAGAYPDAHGTRIPSGPLQPLAPNQDFTEERDLTPDNFLDTCFHGFTGGHITWPESGVRLRFEPAESCRHLVLYNPEKPYFAVEPVLNANDGVNLLARGDETAGTVVLAPGETLASACSLIVEA